MRTSQIRLRVSSRVAEMASHLPEMHILHLVWTSAWNTLPSQRLHFPACLCPLSVYLWLCDEFSLAECEQKRDVACRWMKMTRPLCLVRAPPICCLEVKDFEALQEGGAPRLKERGSWIAATQYQHFCELNKWKQLRLATESLQFIFSHKEHYFDDCSHLSLFLEQNSRCSVNVFE